jgi:thiol:disulfide interchange protein DsbD
MRIPSAPPVKLVLLSLLTASLAFGLAPLTLAKGAAKVAAPVAAAPTTLTWGNDLRAALASARTSRRWVLVDCYTVHCGWCKKLDADTFQDPNVARQLGNHFVWCKCDTDDPNTGAWVKDKYQPDGYPCVLILDPYGTEKGRILGYLPPSAFVSRVAKIVRQ